MMAQLQEESSQIKKPRGFSKKKIKKGQVDLGPALKSVFIILASYTELEPGFNYIRLYRLVRKKISKNLKNEKGSYLQE